MWAARFSPSAAVGVEDPPEGSYTLNQRPAFRARAGHVAGEIVATLDAEATPPASLAAALWDERAGYVMNGRSGHDHQGQEHDEGEHDDDGKGNSTVMNLREPGCRPMHRFASMDLPRSRISHPSADVTLDGVVKIVHSDPDDGGFGFQSAITAIEEDPTDGTLYVVGFAAPKPSDFESHPLGVDTVFTTPSLATITADTPWWPTLAEAQAHAASIDADPIAGCSLGLRHAP